MLYAEDMYRTDMDAYRDHFPALRQMMNDEPLVYLDTAASAQKPKVVIEAMSAILSNEYSNIHRGLYSFSQSITKRYEVVREKVAQFIGAPSPQEVIFTRNTTEAINLVAQSWARHNLSKDDEIILTEMEHHANLVPWQMLRDEIGFKIKYIPVLDDGALDLDAFERMLTPATKFLSIVHISNAFGTVNNVNKIIEIAKDFYPEMKILVDGSQAVVHKVVNVQDLNCDFYVFTGHKLYGPTGVGVLWGRDEVLQSMPPYQGGGDMIEKVSLHDVSYKPSPARFEAGTPAIVEVIGLGVAIDYLAGLDFDMLIEHENKLLDYAMEQLSQIESLSFYGTAADKVGIISMTASWGHISDIAMILDQCGVAVRTGHHCCMPLMERFGIDGTLRVSMGLYTNRHDINALVRGLEKAKDMLE